MRSCLNRLNGKEIFRGFMADIAYITKKLGGALSSGSRKTVACASLADNAPNVSEKPPSEDSPQPDFADALYASLQPSHTKKDTPIK